ncbi:MAG: C4-dicarboxylate TRAP transporter substrate-binding protein [Alphaproteobacteria bacterium]
MAFRYAKHLGIAAALAAAIAAPASAAETINLTSISGYPPAATWVKAFREAFMPKVNEILAKDGKYTIAWNEGFSGTIVKPRGELEGIQSGIGDMGLVVTAFHADKLPLHKLTFVTPFVSTDLALMVKTMGDLEKEFPAFAKIWDANNQVNLVLTGAVDDYMLMSKAPIKTIGDIKGLKIGASGSNLPWVTALGATGVTTNLADAYNSLNTGIYQGGIFWAEAAKSFKLCEPAPYFFDADMGGVQSHNISVNKDVWAKLPAPVKQAMLDAAPAHQKAATGFVVGGASEGIDFCKTTYKSEVFKATPAERTAWVGALKNEAKLWAEDLEKASIPGKAILTVYMDRMRAANQPIARHWDRE